MADPLIERSAIDILDGYPLYILLLAAKSFFQCRKPIIQVKFSL